MSQRASVASQWYSSEGTKLSRLRFIITRYRGLSGEAYSKRRKPQRNPGRRRGHLLSTGRLGGPTKEDPLLGGPIREGTRGLWLSIWRRRLWRTVQLNPALS